MFIFTFFNWKPSSIFSKLNPLIKGIAFSSPKIFGAIKAGDRGYSGVLLYSTKALDMGREENKKTYKS